MQREQAWMSMSEGSTGTRILSALRGEIGHVVRVDRGRRVDDHARVAPSGMRSWKARVVRLSRS